MTRAEKQAALTSGQAPRARATLEQLKKRWGVMTALGPADDPELIIFEGMGRERWVRILKGHYEKSEEP